MENRPAEKIRPLARGTLRLQSDERLLRLFRRDVEPAFDELVNRYRDALVGYAGSIAGHDRAEDVVQDALVKAHRSLKADRDIEPRPWLYAVVRNTALNDIRDNRKHRHDGIRESASGGTSPSDLVEQRERFAAVLAAVADLPPAQRRALVDHELSGFSHEEIAAELDLSTGATKQLIYRARLSLRNAFGAMIPLPVIAWLAAEGGGMVAAGGAAGTGGAAGILGSIGGGTAAKLAVVAVVAGGSVAGGIAVEKQRSEAQRGPESARAAEPTSGDPSGETQVSLVAADDSSERGTGEDGSEAERGSDRSGRGSDDGKREGSRGEDGSGERSDDSPESRPSHGSRPGGRTPVGGSGSGDDSGEHSGGDDRPSGGEGSGRPPRPSDDDDFDRPSRPSGDGSGSGSGGHGSSDDSGSSGGSGSSGNSGSHGGSGSDDDSGSSSGSGSSGGSGSSSGSGSSGGSESSGGSGKSPGGSDSSGEGSGGFHPEDD